MKHMCLIHKQYRWISLTRLTCASENKRISLPTLAKRSPSKSALGAATPDTLPPKCLVKVYKATTGTGNKTSERQSAIATDRCRRSYDLRPKGATSGGHRTLLSEPEAGHEPEGIDNG